MTEQPTTTADQLAYREHAATLARDAVRNIPDYTVREHLEETLDSDLIDADDVLDILNLLTTADITINWPADQPENTDPDDDQDDSDAAPSLPDQVLGILSADLTPEQTATALRDLFVDHHLHLIHIADAATNYINAPDGTSEAYDTYEVLVNAVEEAGQQPPPAASVPPARAQSWQHEIHAVVHAALAPFESGAYGDLRLSADRAACIASAAIVKAKLTHDHDPIECGCELTAADGVGVTASKRAWLSAADRELIAAVVAEVRAPGVLPAAEQAVIETARAWRWSGETADGHRRAEAAHFAAIDALPPLDADPDAVPGRPIDTVQLPAEDVQSAEDEPVNIRTWLGAR